MAVEVTVHPPSGEDILKADDTFQGSLKESKNPSEPKFLQRAKRRAVPFLAAGTALLAAACGSGAKAGEPNPNAAVASIATPTEIPPTATTSSTPEPPKPTATTEPTKVPPTPTKEATPIPKPENPLPSYGVFFGNVTDPKTGAKVAEWVMASIPQKEGLDEIFIYSITSPSVAGTRKHSASQVKPRNLKGTHFELGGTINIWEKADFNEETQTITGVTYSITGITASGNESTLTLKFVGTGKEAILKAMRQVISDQSSDQPTTPEKELAQYHIKADLWP